MPRLACVDAAAALHQVIIHGIEGRNIFTDNKDRGYLLERLYKLLSEAKQLEPGRKPKEMEEYHEEKRERCLRVFGIPFRTSNSPYSGTEFPIPGIA